METWRMARRIQWVVQNKYNICQKKIFAALKSKTKIYTESEHSTGCDTWADREHWRGIMGVDEDDMEGDKMLQ